MTTARSDAAALQQAAQACLWRIAALRRAERWDDAKMLRPRLEVLQRAAAQAEKLAAVVGE